MSTHPTFGDYIRKERNRMDMGLREAARVIGISASYLSRLEAGDFPPPSGEVLHKIARAYCTDIKVIFDLASNRGHEFMAADPSTTPVLQEFYRLAHDRTPEEQERMLGGAIDALKLPEAQKKILMDELRAALSRTHRKDLPRRALDSDGLFAFDIAPRILSRIQIRSLAFAVLKKVFGSEIPIPVPIETVIRKFDENILLIVHNEIEAGRLRDGSPSILGLSRWSLDGRRRELVIHEDLYETDCLATRRRAHFTMAHELFHCIEHLPLVQRRCPELSLARKANFISLSPQLLNQPWFKKKRRPRRLFTNEDWREWQANQFAAELLMPAACVTEAFQGLFGVPRIVAGKDNINELSDSTARHVDIDLFGEDTSLVDLFDVNPQPMAIRLITLGLVGEEENP